MTGEIQFLEKIRRSAGIRLCLLFFTLFIFLIVTSGISGILENSSSLSERSILLISSALQCVLVFIIPSVITSFFASSRPLEWLGLERPVKIKNIIGVVMVYVISLPAMEYIIEWNKGISFPEAFSGLEATLRGLEENGSNFTEKILSASGFGGLLSGVAIVGILTGFSEELFFRGSLQKIFIDSSIGTAASVWICAIIFSAFHFQFFGFVPRMLMGAFFGYLLVWSKSLWVPIIAHALNNSIVVIASFFAGTDYDQALTLSNDGSGIPFMVIASFLFTTIFFVFFRKSLFENKDL